MKQNTTLRHRYQEAMKRERVLLIRMRLNIRELRKIAKSLVVSV